MYMLSDLENIINRNHFTDYCDDFLLVSNYCNQSQGTIRFDVLTNVMTF